MSEKCVFCGSEITVRTMFGGITGFECWMCGAIVSFTTAPKKADALKAYQRRPEPRQLTPDELRQMDGQPIWCEMQPDYYKCGVVGQKHVGDGKMRTVIGFSYGWEWATDMLRRGRIYDRPPGGEEQ